MTHHIWTEYTLTKCKVYVIWFFRLIRLTESRNRTFFWLFWFHDFWNRTGKRFFWFRFRLYRFSFLFSVNYAHPDASGRCNNLQLEAMRCTTRANPSIPSSFCTPHAYGCCNNLQVAVMRCTRRADPSISSEDNKVNVRAVVYICTIMNKN